MAKTSINIQPLRNGYEKHNARQKELPHIRKDLTYLNESWTDQRYRGKSIAQIRQDITERYMSKVSQKMQPNAKPLREGVVVIDDHVTMDMLRSLAKGMEEKFGIKTIDIYIHCDEGHNDEETKTWKPNLHAHMVFDWTTEEGKSVNLKKEQISDMQTLVAEVLGMERGASSSRKHLDAIQYKNKMQEEDNERLSQENKELIATMEELAHLRDCLQKDIALLKITKKGKEALQERLNTFTSLLGKSSMQKKYEASVGELETAKQQIEELQGKVNDIQASLDRRTRERNKARKEADAYKQIAEDNATDARKMHSKLIRVRKENQQLHRQLEPWKYTLPEDVDMARTDIVASPGGHVLRVTLCGERRADLVHLQEDDYQSYISGDVTMEQLVARYYTEEIDRTVAHRLMQLSGSGLEDTLRKIERTLFHALPQILYPLRIPTGPCASQSADGSDLHHKSRDEILMEMIDEGYRVKY